MRAVVSTLETGLQLEPQHAHVQALLSLYDPELRLRKSANTELRKQGCGWVLERTSREKRPAVVNDPDYRIAARDGYVVISAGVHISRLMRPDSILEELYEGDMARQTTAERFSKIVGAQDDAKAARKKARFDNFKGFYAESFDILERTGDAKSHAERTRINNAGAESFAVNDRRRVTLDASEPAKETPCP